jgi:hypothetical protein
MLAPGFIRTEMTDVLRSKVVEDSRKRYSVEKNGRSGR